MLLLADDGGAGLLVLALLSAGAGKPGTSDAAAADEQPDAPAILAGAHATLDARRATVSPAGRRHCAPCNGLAAAWQQRCREIHCSPFCFPSLQHAAGDAAWEAASGLQSLRAIAAEQTRAGFPPIADSLEALQAAQPAQHAQHEQLLRRLQLGPRRMQPPWPPAWRRFPGC